MRLLVVIALCATLFTAASAIIHAPQYQPLPTLRERAKIQDGWTAKRLTAVPALLKKHGLDAWLLSQREYAEDTVFGSVKSAITFSARRRTTMLFHTNTSSLAGQPNPLIWIDNTPDLWNNLLVVLEEFDPQTIGINVQKDIAFADGLHAGELVMLASQIGPRWMRRTRIEPMVAVEFIATRIPEQLEWYRKMQENIWAMIAEGFSTQVITPGVTTTEDVVWWFREKMLNDLKTTTWFHPSVSVFRAEGSPHSSNVIQAGDMLHVDIGITALGLNTDTQHLGYVLRDGETDVPEGLKAGLRKANRMQDIVVGNMEPGLTGNEVLTRCLAQMARENIEGNVYSHPIGDFGHSAGSLIGMTNLPTNVPILGDLSILPATYYSIELSAAHFVQEWNTTVPFMQEEDVAWSDSAGGWQWVYGRQEEFHIVRPPRPDAQLRVQG